MSLKPDTKTQRHIAATTMKINAIPPMTPPTMAPAWLPECECLGGTVEDALAEDVVTEEVLAEDVYTPEAPKIAPGPYSGLSISNVGVRP
jgi:hypothetical protein